jgi:hypothetical protein
MAELFSYNCHSISMKNAKRLTIALIFISSFNCHKEEQNSIEPAALLNSDSEMNSAGIQSVCDDVTAFKSLVDLEPLDYVQDCFSSTAIKEVPGLGSVPWASDGIIRNIDNRLYPYFRNYKQYFEEFLARESLNFNNIPLSIGTYVVHDDSFWEQNMEAVYCNYHRLLDDGDVADGHWRVDTNCVNFIEITHLDLECKEVRGNFEVHMTMTQQGQTSIQYSERINFLNGAFYARIIQL